MVGHNDLGFDLAALEPYYGLNLARLVEAIRVMDTLLVARQNDPPISMSRFCPATVGVQPARQGGVIP